MGDHSHGFCQERSMVVPLTKIRLKYDALLKKWRDFGPGNGKKPSKLVT
jgi:hypothetical protein